MREVTVIVFVAGGALFTVLAAVGVFRMPDLFTRIQTATKATTLGVACVMVAAAAYFGDLSTATRAGLITGFLFCTAPVAAHAIGRAAYFDGVVLWENTQVDELRHRYDRRTHALGSRSAAAEKEKEETPVSTR